MKLIINFLLLLALLVQPVSYGQMLDVVNGGFEDASVGVPFNEFTFGPPAGWDLYDPHGITSGGAGPTFFVGTLMPTPITSPPAYEFFPDGAAQGQRVAIAFNYAGSGDLGEYGLIQMLDPDLTANTLQPHTAYTLLVDVGNIASGIAVNGDSFNLDGFPGYRIDLLAGDVVIASDDNTLSGLIPEGQFATSTVQFTTGDTHPQMDQPLGIRLANLNLVDAAAPLADLEVDFDHVRLFAVIVPEPASGMLMLLAVMLVHSRHHRPSSG